MLRVDGHGERRLEPRRVLAHDHRYVELVETLPGHGKADQAATVARHEVDRVGSDLLRGDGQVPFVLAILVVHHDQHAAATKGLDGVVDAREPRTRRTLAGRGGRRLRFVAVGHGRLDVVPLGSPPNASSARATYFPMISHSMLTASPTRRAWRLVRSPGVGNDLHGEAVRLQTGHGQADPIDRDRSLRHEKACEIRGKTHGHPPEVGLLLDPGEASHGVDVSLHEVPPQSVGRQQGAFQVHGRPFAADPPDW